MSEDDKKLVPDEAYLIHQVVIVKYMMPNGDKKINFALSGAPMDTTLPELPDILGSIEFGKTLIVDHFKADRENPNQEGTS